jgi:hypothetical protein
LAHFLQVVDPSDALKLLMLAAALALLATTEVRQAASARVVVTLSRPRAAACGAVWILLWRSRDGSPAALTSAGGRQRTHGGVEADHAAWRGRSGQEDAGEACCVRVCTVARFPPILRVDVLY